MGLEGKWSETVAELRNSRTQKCFKYLHGQAGDLGSQVALVMEIIEFV